MPASQPAIQFNTTAEQINQVLIARLPEVASRALPSRGQVAVKLTVDGHETMTVVEPDGRMGHWLKLSGVKPGMTMDVSLTPTKQWPEPEVPTDLKMAIEAAADDIRTLWATITPMARWEWVRWVNATANDDTRQRRVEVSISKMKNGKRRPCCFNLSACTDPSVSKNAQLIDG